MFVDQGRYNNRIREAIDWDSRIGESLNPKRSGFFHERGDAGIQIVRVQYNIAPSVKNTLLHPFYCSSCDP